MNRLLGLSVPLSIACVTTVEADIYQWEYVDPANQISVSHHYYIDGDRVAVSSPSFRYVWPSERDLMAQLAGMELESRWADWDRSPFGGDSPSHVSVWRKV